MILAGAGSPGAWCSSINPGGERGDRCRGGVSRIGDYCNLLWRRSNRNNENVVSGQNVRKEPVRAIAGQSPSAALYSLPFDSSLEKTLAP